MNVARRLFRQAAALALAAILGLALAPTVSHALAAQQASVQPWSELCSPGGEQDAGARLAHCPLCAQPGHASAPPLTPPAPWAAPAAAHERPAAVPAGVLSTFARLSPPPRAPPQVVPA